MNLVSRLVDTVSLLRERPVASVTAAAALYLLLARALRFRRRDKIVREYGYSKRPLASMTVDEAYEIHRQLCTLEFPETFKTSLFFALFKVRHVPVYNAPLALTPPPAFPDLRNSFHLEAPPRDRPARLHRNSLQACR